MSRGHFRDWPDCLTRMSVKELEGWLRGFYIKADAWPAVRKECLKRARTIEKELARREESDDE